VGRAAAFASVETDGSGEDVVPAAPSEVVSDLGATAVEPCVSTGSVGYDPLPVFCNHIAVPIEQWWTW